MRREYVQTSPGLKLEGLWLDKPRYEWRVMLNARERRCLERAYKILDDARALVDGGSGDLYDDAETLAKAAMWVDVAVTTPYFTPQAPEPAP